MPPYHQQPWQQSALPPFPYGMPAVPFDLGSNSYAMTSFNSTLPLPPSKPEEHAKSSGDFLLNSGVRNPMPAASSPSIQGVICASKPARK